ncbi:hypothetical protein [Pelagicoccus sp. SDUM812003]|uniref:hypothetical protein n=1 Tax=Pelagicoccus sp. SDUM812003 TaxID=3041267 RepID=UPI00280F977C|nr:hypothetical protein [Pelagicoccus sp. SDUM812003]MDQ8205801.1 hypothetical protein [Pelagicoccus sp. SDUM812003]
MRIDPGIATAQASGKGYNYFPFDIAEERIATYTIQSFFGRRFRFTLVASGLIPGYVPGLPTTYLEWASEHYPIETLLDYEDQGRSLDFDNDGLTFEDEYVLKSNPFLYNELRSRTRFDAEGHAEIEIWDYQYDAGYELVSSTDLKNWSPVTEFQFEETSFARLIIMNSDGARIKRDDLPNALKHLSWSELDLYRPQGMGTYSFDFDPSKGPIFFKVRVTGLEESPE